MKKYLNKIYSLAISGTAKDTYILFIGNIIAAFLGFVTTIIIARSFSVEDFGIYSAVTNLIVIIASITDLGLSSGLIGFAAKAFREGDTYKAHQYSKAAFLIKIYVSIPLVLACFIFAKYVSPNWLATSSITMSYWVGIISLLAISWGFLPFILQAKKEFLKSTLVDISLSLPKAVIPYALMLFGLLTIETTLAAFAVSAAIAGVVGFAFVGLSFLKVKSPKYIYIDLLKYSSWLGVGRIISSITGRLDIQMLAIYAGAIATGQYSIPAKLASFLTVLVASFGAVIAPRMASMGTKNDERTYLMKTTLAILPLVGLIILWLLFAKPFILILFGDKYLQSVPIFQAIIASMIPYLLCVPPTQAIIYSMKKTIYPGIFTIIQLPVMFGLNYMFIPIYGVYGPAITLAIVNTIGFIYAWIIVVKHYWVDK